MKDRTIIALISTAGLAALAIAVPMVMPHSQPATPIAIIQPPIVHHQPTTQEETDKFNAQIITWPGGDTETMQQFMSDDGKYDDALKAQITSQEITITSLKQRLNTLEHPTQGVPKLQIEKLSLYYSAGTSIGYKLVNPTDSLTITKVRFNGDHDAELSEDISLGSAGHVLHPNGTFPQHLGVGGTILLFKQTEIPSLKGYNYANEVEYIDVTTEQGTFRYTTDQFNQWTGVIKP